VRGEHVLRALRDDRPLLRRVAQQMRVADMKHVLKFSTAEQPDVKEGDEDEEEELFGAVAHKPKPK